MPANPSRLGLKVVVALLFVAAAVTGTFFFLRPVAKVETIARGNAANVVPAAVIVTAGRVSPIESDVDGRLLTSELHPGNEVKEGAIIAQLDTTDVDLEIQRAQNEYDAADKRIAIAKKISDLRKTAAEEELEEAKRRDERNEAPKLDLPRRKRDFDIAAEQRSAEEAENARTLAALKNTLSTAQRKKDKMTIKAPFDGVIAESFVNVKALVTPQQRLATLISSDRTVWAKIGEEHFAAIQVGQKAKVSFLGYPDKTFEATVVKKLPTADPGTQRYTAQLEVEIEPGKLLPNLTGDAAIYIDEHRDVVLVPRRAIKDGYVYVVENNRVRQQRIDLGFTDLVKAEVTSGLKPGDRVIVEWLENFRDGQWVRVE